MKRLILAVVSYTTLAGVAFAQTPPPPAEVHGEPISSLMFFTLGIALVLAIGAFLWFLRKRSNRDAADRALNPNNPRNN